MPQPGNALSPDTQTDPEEEEEDEEQEEEEEEPSDEEQGENDGENWEEEGEEETEAEAYELPAMVKLEIQSYEGEMEADQPHGRGVAWFDGGHTYKGMFSKGLMDGQGQFIWAGGMKYEGDFVDNMPVGQGTYTWPNGGCFTGEVFNGKRHGSGTFTCARYGVMYVGQWDLGKRHGQGVMYFNVDRTSWYKGEWKKNNRQGYGEKRFPSGNVYSGEWRNNVRHGEGTMKWLKLGQEYQGSWQDGVQHGKGVHVWILRRTNISQYSQNNRYEGDFYEGQRHGQGTFYYAGGATYEGEWKHNKKHGKGTFTFKDGHVFEGEFVDDRMVTPNMDGNKALTPLCGALVLSRAASATLGPDMVLNIDRLLEEFPEKKRQAELKQVEFAIMRNNAELRSIYSYYSRLGTSSSANNIFLLTRLQLWRLLKDCKLHYDIPLPEINQLISEDTETDIHYPFSTFPLRGFLSCLVIVAYNILGDDIESEEYTLSSCLSKLLSEDILPNAKKVGGFVFGVSDPSTVTVAYMQRCFEVYETYRQLYTGSTEGELMTYRHVLWMFRDLHLLDKKLSTVRLMRLFFEESPDPKNMSASLSQKITFLEFFEVLVGAASLKCRAKRPSASTSSTDPSTEHPSSTSETDTTGRSEVECSSSSVSEADFTDSTDYSSPQISSDSPQDVRARMPLLLRVAVEQAAQFKGLKQVGVKDLTVHQFFNQLFFPAVDHHQLITKLLKEGAGLQETGKS